MKGAKYVPGTFVSSSMYRPRTAISQPGNVGPNQNVGVDARLAPLSLDMKNFHNGDRLVITDKFLSFATNPVTLTAPSGYIFSQTGTDQYVMNQVGSTDEWAFRLNDGFVYLEFMPQVNVGTFMAVLTTTPGIPISVAHGLGTKDYFVRAYNVDLRLHQEIQVQPDTDDLNVAWVDSNHSFTYRILFVKF